MIQRRDFVARGLLAPILPKIPLFEVTESTGLDVIMDPTATLRTISTPVDSSAWVDRLLKIIKMKSELASELGRFTGEFNPRAELHLCRLMSQLAMNPYVTEQTIKSQLKKAFRFLTEIYRDSSKLSEYLGDQVNQEQLETYSHNLHQIIEIFNLAINKRPSLKELQREAATGKDDGAFSRFENLAYPVMAAIASSDGELDTTKARERIEQFIDYYFGSLNSHQNTTPESRSRERLDLARRFDRTNAS